MKFLVLVGYLFLNFNNLSAQLCNGNLGDPIVNITFGTGEDLGHSVTSFQNANDCPGMGKYAVGSFLLGCGDHTWFLLAGDHTGNQDGALMVVNAENTPGIVYTDTADGLCGNTTYQFAAWISNVMQKISCGGNPVLPNLTFTVSTLQGVVLGTYNTGDLPVERDRIWTQFGLSFTTPTDVTSVIYAITTRPGVGCGSAFSIDDITLNVCGPAAVKATIDGETGPQDVCADYKNPFILQGSYTPGFKDPVTLWQNSTDTGKSWNDIPEAMGFTYAVPRRTTGMILYRFEAAERVNVKSAKCRTPSNSIYTNVHPVPDHKPPVNLMGCIGKDLLFPEADPSALGFLFTGPNGYSSTSPKPIIANVNYSDTGLYKLDQNFYFGCTSADTFHLQVFPGTTINTLPLYSICDNMSVNLSATGEGKYKWTPPTGLSDDTIPNPVAQPHDTTVYEVTLTNSFGCKDSAEVTINVSKNPSAYAGPDLEIMSGDSVMLNGEVGGTQVSFSWSPNIYINDNSLLHPTVFPPGDMQYTLTATSGVGCGSAVSGVNIRIFTGVYIPTAFTPNEDGINDRFKITMANSNKIKKFFVYNRWGQMVYNNEKLSEGWDGTYKGILQPVGTYLYYIEILTSSGKLLEKKGTIVLLQ